MNQKNMDQSKMNQNKVNQNNKDQKHRNQSKRNQEKKNRFAWMRFLYILILVLYPLRHITWGLDLWDTGYNYANFRYMGLEHMDSMWLFSTYLANAVGNFLTRLPLAGSLVGMNFYTGLFVSLLALSGYLFCTKKLGISPLIAFLGEFAAISLCWCPTALLYNYLTFVLFLGCVILLYKGLTEGKKSCLFAAGLCLGTNVLVRFSNLPQAAMILAVWAYGVIEAGEKRRAWRANEGDWGSTRRATEGERGSTRRGAEGKYGSTCRATEGERGSACRIGAGEPVRARYAGAWAAGFQRTLWCLGGYLTALLVLFGYIHLKYGLDAYAAGIQRLFAMTDNATDYKAASMLMGIVSAYTENLYWAVRILVILAGGILLFGVVKLLERRFTFFRERPAAAKLDLAVKILWSAVCVCMLAWLYYRGFCSLEFYSYGAILRPGILFLMLTMFIALIRIFNRNSSKEEKLVSGMLILVILLTSIGSNNGVYPSLNNLFVAAPYTLWECRKFFGVADGKWRKLIVCSFPVKAVLASLGIMFLVQSIIFGACFVFVEATGAQDVSASISNNEVLEGVKMSPERAEWMRSASDYVAENQLNNKTVILYGQIPALSYYLQMPSAFNPWSDLRSYSLKTMEQDMGELSEKMDRLKPDYETADAARPGKADASGNFTQSDRILAYGENSEKRIVQATDITQEQVYFLIRPVIILEKTYAQYLTGGREALEAADVEENRITQLEQDKKLLLIETFMEKHNYQQTFSNDKFVFWE